MICWLSDTLRSRAGSLAPVAERFLHEWLGPERHGFGGGAAGLIALCEHMERWLALDQVDAEQERRFVEGAGALLGLLLIDHLGDAAHAARGSVHRVRLGQYGFFDPFAAVDRALDAPDLRVELSRQVGEAEAEARARGPVSRVVRALLAALERERPDLALEDHFDLSLSLRSRANAERIEIDLRRAVDSTRDQGFEAVEAVARRLLALVPGAPELPCEFDQLRDRLVPRLARGDALRELQGLGKHGLYAAPFSQELVIALLVEYEGRARYVRESELASWGISGDQALGIALENLAARSEHARIACTETAHGPLLVARTGDGRDSARVLLKSLYRALSSRLGDQVFVSVPHRDTFFACAGQNPPLLAELTRRTAHDAARAPHRLSARLFQLTPSGVLE